MVKTKIDLCGKKFNRLLVLNQEEDYIDPSNRKWDMWKCKCDCGNYTIVRGHSLKTNGVKSCGCLLNEKIHQKRNNNKYDLSGEYGIGYTNKGEEFYFDLEDYDLIKDYTWMLSDNGNYLTTCVSNNNKQQTLRMHRLITNCPSDRRVDHINHNTRDNRKSNLRICTQIQNVTNSIKNKNNVSGYKGVYWNDALFQWISSIPLNGKNKTLGRFDHIQEAVDCRNRAEKKYFKSFANVEDYSSPKFITDRLGKTLNVGDICIAYCVIDGQLTQIIGKIISCDLEGNVCIERLDCINKDDKQNYTIITEHIFKFEN